MLDPVDQPEALRIAHVVLALDGSDLALAAVPTALALADRFAARLVTISVAGDDDKAEQLRRHAAESLAVEPGDERIRVVVSADPAEAISSFERELGSCVVCLSTRGRGRISGSVIGSVARSVLVSSPAPVVAVGPQADRPDALVGRPRRRPAGWPEPLSEGGIVACVDGSTEAEAVLPVAAAWATALDVDLTILTIAEDAAATPGGDRPNRFGPPDPRGYVDQLAGAWQDRAPGVTGDVQYDPISITSGLQAHLAERPAALVALTANARSGLDRLRLGATSADLVRVSTAPALVVPAASLTAEADQGG
jgi:nucleotide-binding universal stress UspA family protein